MEWERRWLNGLRQEGAASRGAGSYAWKRGRRLQWQPRVLKALSGPGAAAFDTREESEEAQRRDYLDAPFCPAAFLDGRLALDSTGFAHTRTHLAARLLIILHSRLAAEATVLCPIWARECCIPRQWAGEHRSGCRKFGMGLCLAEKLEGVQRFEVRKTRNRDLGGGARNKKHRNFIQRWPERQIRGWSSQGNGVT